MLVEVGLLVQLVLEHVTIIWLLVLLTLLSAGSVVDYSGLIGGRDEAGVSFPSAGCMAVETLSTCSHTIIEQLHRLEFATLHSENDILGG